VLEYGVWEQMGRVGEMGRIEKQMRAFVSLILLVFPNT
jgi:hypothetical protein